jgi:SAM-dependent methyltransferase
MGGEKSASARQLPPALLLRQFGVGHYVSRALYVAAKLGVADVLKDGPRRSHEIAKATGTHALSLRRVLRLLASVNVFEERDNNTFALAPMGELLRDDTTGSMRAWVMLFTGIGVQDSWKELEYCVRTGQPAFRKNHPDGDAFSNMTDPEQRTVFDKAMATFTSGLAIAVAAAYPFAQFGTVADIGGGNGALLIGILKAAPELNGIVFDLPATAESARQKIADEGLGSRCRVIGGDFFKEVPAGADAYMLKHVIHDWDDEKAVTILKNCRRAMMPNGRVLIVEGIYPARIDNSLESRGAAENDVNMLVVAGGRQRSEAEFGALFEAAGFRLARIAPTAARVSVIEGVPR